MKKKFIKYIALSFCFISLVSCNKWLEATSSTQISDKQMFCSRSGFHEALSGVYLIMGDQNMYGSNMTLTLLDGCSMPMASQLLNPVFSQIIARNFSNARVVNMSTATWGQSYNMIANINKILSELDSHKDVISDELEYNLIKGELLGLRAYVMFDIMRIFGLDSWDGANAEKLAVPYPLEYAMDPWPQKTYSATAAQLMEDINAAIECLSGDPIRGNAPASFEEMYNTDGYWSNRTLHFNYFAAKALKARVYLWEKDYARAAASASDVIEEAFATKTVSWLDADAFAKASVNDRDPMFGGEHLFTLDITNLYETTMVMFSVSTNGYAAYSYKTDFVRNQLFSGLPGQEDVRGPSGLLTYTVNGYVPNKILKPKGSNLPFLNKMPMVRVSEMYYILAEAALEKDADADSAMACLNIVRSHRGITDPMVIPASLLSAPEKADYVEIELQKEYLREFSIEGRYFYFYKRNIPGLMKPVDTEDDASIKLMYRYPLAETAYGRKQEE